MTPDPKAKSIWGRVAAMFSHCIWLGAAMGAGHAMLVAFGMAITGDGGPLSGLWFVLLVAGMLGAMTGLGVSVVVVPLVWDRDIRAVFVRLGISAGAGSALGLVALLLLGGQLIGSTTDELLGLLGFWGLPVAGFVGGAVWCRVRLPVAWRRWPEVCCQRCGYDNRGIEGSARCPECGSPSALTARSGTSLAAAVSHTAASQDAPRHESQAVDPL